MNERINELTRLTLEGKMYADEATEFYNHETDTWNYYYAKANGVVAEKEWVQRGGYWYYYGTDGKAANFTVSGLMVNSLQIQLFNTMVLAMLLIATA